VPLPVGEGGEQALTLSTRDLRTIIVGALVAASILVYALVAAPLKDRWQSASERLTKARQQEQLLRRIAEQTEARRKQKRDLGRQFTTVANLQNAAQQAPRIIAQLEDLDSFRNIGVERYDPVPSHEQEQYAACSVMVMFRCDLKQLQAVLYDLQEAEPRLNVERLLVVQERKGRGRLRVQMLVTSYVVEADILGPEGGLVG